MTPIQELIAEYLLTLDDTDKHESWCTDRDGAEYVLNQFIHWVNARKVA